MRNSKKERKKTSWVLFTKIINDKLINLLLPSLDLKHKTIFSPLFTEYDVNLSVYAVSLMLSTLKFLRKRILLLPFGLSCIIKFTNF